MTNKLEVDSVILNYGSNRILKNIYFKSQTGTVTGLLGRNGTGKSSLLNVIFGTCIPLDKSIRINGKALLGVHRSPLDMRYLPQSDFIPKSLKVKRVFLDFQVTFDSFLKFFPEFKKHYNSRMQELSGGERRIIAIFLILTSNTKFCLLDEPFSQIMPIHIERIKELILKEKERKGIVITDHMYRHILDLSDNLYLIKNGTAYTAKNKEDLQDLGYILLD